MPKKDHVVCIASLNAELLVFRRPRSSGYTVSLDEAGRFTKTEASALTVASSGGNLGLPIRAVARESFRAVNRSSLERILERVTGMKKAKR